MSDRPPAGADPIPLAGSGSAAAPSGDLVPGRLVTFGRSLREHGVRVGTSDLIDAAAAAAVLGWEDRERLREAFAATLLRRSAERRLFDELFDLYFPRAIGGRGPQEPPPPRPERGTPAAAKSAAELRERAAALRAELSIALAQKDTRALEQIAERAVSSFGQLRNAATTGSYSSAQALDVLAPQTAIAAALRHLQQAAGGSPGGSGDGNGPGSGGGGSGGSPLVASFAREELRAEVAAFRRRVESEARRRNAQIRGADRIARYAVRPPVDQTSFVMAGPEEVAQLRAAMGPLARKLATRIAARRRRGAGAPIDIRRTLRRSLATGGVPMNPARVRHTRSRVDLVLLCDMSSSVAGFSRFTILLMQALSAHFRRLRVFGFVNAMDELTQVVREAPPGADLTAAFADLSRMTRWHNNSDYGSALADFTQHHLEAVGHRSVVLILGDARTNSTDPGLAHLHAIVERARSVIWLNPEPARQWDSGDSVAHRYAQIVDMHECRNLAQLREFIGRLLPV